MKVDCDIEWTLEKAKEYIESQFSMGFFISHIERNNFVRSIVVQDCYVFFSVILDDDRFDNVIRTDDGLCILASYYRSDKIVKMLVDDERVDVTTDENYILRACVIYDNLDLLKHMKKSNRFDFSFDNNRLLDIAIDNHNARIVEFLMEDINVLKNLKVSLMYSPIVVGILKNKFNLETYDEIKSFLLL